MSGDAPSLGLRLGWTKRKFNPPFFWRHPEKVSLCFLFQSNKRSSERTMLFEFLAAPPYIHDEKYNKNQPIFIADLAAAN